MQLPDRHVIYPQTGQGPTPMDAPLGASGLTGRPQVRPPNTDVAEPIGYDEETGEPIYAQPPAEGPSVPGLCLRALYSPHPDCPSDCPGRQPDGGCLCDIVRAANAQGVEWSFEVRVEEGADPRYGGGMWVYTGPPLIIHRDVF